MQKLNMLGHKNVGKQCELSELFVECGSWIVTSLKCLAASRHFSLIQEYVPSNMSNKFHFCGYNLLYVPLNYISSHKYIIPLLIKQCAPAKCLRDFISTVCLKSCCTTSVVHPVESVFTSTGILIFLFQVFQPTVVTVA